MESGSLGEKGGNDDQGGREGKILGGEGGGEKGDLRRAKGEKDLIGRKGERYVRRRKGGKDLQGRGGEDLGGKGWERSWGARGER